MRLKELTRSDTSDEAVQKFETTLATLRRLDIASSYVELLHVVDTLRFVSLIARLIALTDSVDSSSARQNLRSNPREALPNYARLRSIVEELKTAQPAAEGAAPHLVDHVDLQTTNLWEQMRKAFADDLEKTLEHMAWPDKNLRLEEPVLNQWREQVSLLLDLQEP